jgi:hypothetical protein
MTMGRLEGEKSINNLMNLQDSLISRKYPGLQVTSDIFEGETHSSCMPAAVSRAFKILQKAE